MLSSCSMGSVVKTCNPEREKPLNAAVKAQSVMQWEGFEGPDHMWRWSGLM